MVELKQEFKNMLHDLLGDEAFALLEALDQPPVTSVRLNVRKPVAVFPDFPQTEPVVWCKSGLYLKERPEFIFDPLLHAGAYYVQDASSMIYETVTERLVDKFLQPDKKKETAVDHLKILDLCAAPGGKTTAMINALPDGSHITANEISPKRVNALKENIERWGYKDVTITNYDSIHFANQGEEYDIIAVDAPCSGEGMMRKEEMARTQWSLKLINECAELQKIILQNAVKALKPGGFLIYSTCTFNRRENEGNAEYIVDKLGLNPVDLEFPPEWGIAPGIDIDMPVYRFMPHKTQGEGLFLAVFKKNADITSEENIDNSKNVRKFVNKKSVKPSALFKLESENYPNVEVDKTSAIAFLQGLSLKLPDDAPKGMVKICYQGFELGLAKNIGTRANNLLPKHKRIRKQF